MPNQKRKSFTFTVYYTDEEIELELWENGKPLGRGDADNTLPEILRAAEALAKLTGTCNGVLQAYAGMLAHGTDKDPEDTARIFLNDANNVARKFLEDINIRQTKKDDSK